LTDEIHILEQKYLQADIPLPRVEALFDMGWQVRSSLGKYGSSTGHALLIGARLKLVLDSAVFNKKCGLCTKYEKRIASLHNVPEHDCVKNYEGSSKAMEAAALVKMISRAPDEKGISICTVISDDDSNARSKAKHETDGGILPGDDPLCPDQYRWEERVKCRLVGDSGIQHVHVEDETSCSHTLFELSRYHRHG